MTKLYAFLLVSLVLTLTAATAWGQTSGAPDTVVVHIGPATLHAMLWRPTGRGPFPGILLNHGSGRTREDLERLGLYELNAEKLGPVFARHGCVFLYLFRRGVGFPRTRALASSTLEFVAVKKNPSPGGYTMSCDYFEVITLENN